jgi:hypothetical protein
MPNVRKVVGSIATARKPHGTGGRAPLYAGTKARFETGEGTQIVECYNHNVSDFIQAGKKHGLSVIDLNEYFDEDDRNSIPRILTILFRKN